MYLFPTKAQQGNTLPSCLSFHIVSKYSSHGLFSDTFFFFAYLSFVGYFSALKAPRQKCSSAAQYPEGQVGYDIPCRENIFIR